MDQLRNKDKSVGILCDNSSHTISQLKCLTASIVSRRMESCASELIAFISLLILRARFVIIDLDILGEFTTLDAIETYFFLTILPTLFTRRSTNTERFGTTLVWYRYLQKYRRIIMTILYYSGNQFYLHFWTTSRCTDTPVGATTLSKPGFFACDGPPYDEIPWH